MKISETAILKLQEVEKQLSDAGFSSVWQKVVERFPFDTLYTFWVNLTTGKSVLVVTESGEPLPTGEDYGAGRRAAAFQTPDVVTTYELAKVGLSTLTTVK